MLDGVICIQQPCACNANVLSLAETKHFPDAVRLQQLCIIIQKKQIFALCKRCAEIIDSRIIKALFPGDYMERRMLFFHFLIISKGLRLCTVIFHNNKFQVPVGRFL